MFIQRPEFYLSALNTFQPHHASFYGFRVRKQKEGYFRGFKEYILFEPKLRIFTVSCCETNYKESITFSSASLNMQRAPSLSLLWFNE